MVLFLTSSPTGDLDGKYLCDGFDTRNGFLQDLKSYWKANSKVIMIASDENDYKANEQMGQFFHHALRKSDLSCASFELIDGRNCLVDKSFLLNQDVVLLAGGHVPTQNKFFHKMGLKELFSGFEGIVIGISAGSMNCADIVYAQPELMGEATNPNYQRFIQGLGFTNINVLPHYQIVKDHYLDGYHLFNQISCGDSKDKMFIALVDGSYIKIDNGRFIVKGEAYKLFEDRIERI